MRPVILIGFMGAGKTSIGKKLAAQFQCPFIDTDLSIEQKADKSISRIFSEDGEAAFRKMETEFLKSLIRNNKMAVISTGGGMPVLEENRLLLKELGTVVYLKAEANDIYERLKNDTSRPLLAVEKPKEKIRELLSLREEFYEEAADFIVSTSNKQIHEITLHIVNCLREDKL